MHNGKNRRRDSYSLRDRLNYWFDNHMARSSLVGFIRLLIAASIVLAVIIAGLIILLGFSEDGEAGSVIWDSIATVINAWMPYYEDGSPGYLILMTVTAIAGVLFTSVLIGIITSAIEEKIFDLKKGNSFVLEKDHIVVLGFSPGEYALIRQLILAAEGKPACLVLADDLDRESMEQMLSENLEVPKNFRIVCRTADITDPASIEKCSIETCKTVIISPAEDARTVKAVLAVSALMQEKDISDIRVHAIISSHDYRFPPSLAAIHNITTLQTNEVLAKMIAHSCTQVGLSQTFREVFAFEGSEFLLIERPELLGKSFAELMVQLNHAVPAGVAHNGHVIPNPPPDYVMKPGDKLLVFSEERESAILDERTADHEPGHQENDLRIAEDNTDTVILGKNETLPVILQELPENVSHVFLAGQALTNEELHTLQQICARRNLLLEHYDMDPHSEPDLLELAQMAEHIVILNDHEAEEEESDMEVIFLLLNLRDLRTRYHLHFNITVEMNKEHNQKLVGTGDHTDFLVDSSTSSLILAQLSQNIELIDFFCEILSNEGNELYLKNAADSGLQGTHTVRDLRRIMYQHGYILLGHLDSKKRSTFNLPLDATITLLPEDDIIVLGNS